MTGAGTDNPLTTTLDVHLLDAAFERMAEPVPVNVPGLACLEAHEIAAGHAGTFGVAGTIG